MSVGRLRLVRNWARSTAERGEGQTRAPGWQQEAVAHLGQRALAGASVSALMDDAVAMLARVLDVEFAGLLEFRPESRTLLLRAGVGWQEGQIGRTVIPADSDTHAGYALRSPTPVVVEDLSSDARFGQAPLLNDHGVVSGLTVTVQGKERPFGLLGAHTAEPRAFSIHDVHVLQGVAHILATAIDRARTEEALRQSEEHFRSLIDNASDIITILGDDGIFRFASPSAQRLLGYAPTELIGRNVFELVHPDDVAGVTDTLGRALAEPGTPHMAEFRFRLSDGRWRVLESVGQARRGNGGAMSFVVNSRDVTDRRAQERALRASKERLRTLVASVPLVLFTLDRQGVFTLAEGKGLDALGLRPAQLLGQSVFQVYADAPQTLAEVRRALAGESFTSTVDVFGFTFEVSYAPLRDADGALSGVLGVANDVTDRRRAEEALRRTEENNRVVLQYTSYGIYRSTPAGRILSANPTLVAMLKYDSEAEVLALDMETDVYADPSERPRVLAQFEAADSVRGLEVTWKRKDRTRIVVRLSGRAVRASDGSIDTFETIVEDITERRALEEQVRQSQKIEAIGQLTGGIAHDFNNLLTIILANAELVRNGLGPERVVEQADLGDLISAALRGRVMVRELLDFARRSNVDLQSVVLKRVVVGMSGMLRRILPADIDLVITGDDDVPEVRADVHAVEQIIFNLVTNARDAMPHGGVLRITTAPAMLSEEQRLAARAAPAAAWSSLVVEDTGLGMEESTRQRMFEPFFTTKEKGKGTGLGMATVYGLVKQHGAAIDVNSRPGHGTRIALYFPVSGEKSTTKRARPGRENAAPGGNETILIVEDESDLRRAAKRILEQVGYQVLTAADGVEGLEAIRGQSSPIHLVLSDLVMPRLGGRGLYDAVRRGGWKTPFLFVSGYSPGDGRGNLPPELGVPILDKPWTPDDLLRRVREMLDQQ